MYYGPGWSKNPKGKDPIPALNTMKDGLKEIRQYQKEVIAYVKNEDKVKEYWKGTTVKFALETHANKA